jgi:hypothetical protein
MPSAGSWIVSDGAKKLVWDFRQEVRSTAVRPGHEGATHRQGMEYRVNLWLALRTTSPMFCPGVLWI